MGVCDGGGARTGLRFVQILVLRGDFCRGDPVPNRCIEGSRQLKVAILAGGVGSRLSEETVIKPKPMVEIGGQPILWHIMMHYSHYGFNEFVIALGYKGECIKRFIVDYCDLAGNLTVKTAQRRRRCGTASFSQDWTVDLIDTGKDTMTGGRIKRLQPYMGNETFMLTWGDGVSNVDLHELLEFHKAPRQARDRDGRPPAGRGLGTWCSTATASREFSEKPQTSEGWINGAFFVLEPEVFDYIEGDDDAVREGADGEARAATAS